MSGKSFSFPFATLQWLDGSRGKIVFLLVNSIFFFLSLWLGAKRPLARGKKNKREEDKRENKQEGRKIKREEKTRTTKRRNDKNFLDRLSRFYCLPFCYHFHIHFLSFCRHQCLFAGSQAVEQQQKKRQTTTKRQNTMSLTLWVSCYQLVSKPFVVHRCRNCGFDSAFPNLPFRR